MTNKYEEYTKDIYKTIRDDLVGARQAQAGSNLPTLLYSGENHDNTAQDKEIFKTLPDEDVNPAMADSCAHIAAMKAAVDVYGKENVIVSVEMDQKTLDAAIEAAKNLGDTEHFPLSGLEAVRYAVKNGLDIRANDPVTTGSATSKERLDAQTDILQKHALETGSSSKVIVAIGGAGHIGYLQGFTPAQLATNGHELTRNPEEISNQFEGMYGQMLFYNSAQYTPNYPEMKDLYASYPDIEKQALSNPNLGHYLGALKEINYARNPANATQFDPPGRMSHMDLHKVSEYVDEAAKEYDQNLEKTMKTSGLEQPPEDPTFAVAKI